MTNNMFVYETERDILLVDCGVGFPTGEMPGVDLTIPDISYLLPRKGKIRGLILSHGHDDHLGALPYILPPLPKIPIFASRWAKALGEEKLKEAGLSGRFEEVRQGARISLGDFTVEFIEVTHSIPETLHLVIATPLGIFYHAADFKLDLTPVMGRPTDQNLIKRVGEKGVFCLLSDCLRAERPGFTPSETQLEEMFEREISTCQGRFLVTMMSSNISRLKQAIDVSLRHGRQIVPIGRSVEKNLTLALKLGYLKYPKEVLVDLRQIKRRLPSSLTFLVAGSQAQTGSALERIVAHEREVEIKSGDKVVFSTDYIPGNEVQIFELIDQILLQGAEVVYAENTSDIHVSGHGQAQDLKKLIELTHPGYLLPIGGNLRHMMAYQKLALGAGYPKEKILLPFGGQVVEFSSDGHVRVKKKVEVRTVMVDALGVGDVGHVVLRDRQVLAREGMVLVVAQISQGDLNLLEEPEIITRGFVYAKGSEKLLVQAKNEVKKVLAEQKPKSLHLLRRRLQETLENFFYGQTGRQPMILPVLIEI